MMDLSLLQDFIAETTEHLEEMENNLLKLEENSGDPEVLNDIFRSAHTIKGSAEYLGMEKIAKLSHRLENLLELLRHGEHFADREVIDTLIDSRDRIAALTNDLERTRTEETEIGDLIRRIDGLSSPERREERKKENSEISEKDPEADFLSESLAMLSDENEISSDTCDDIELEEARQHYDKLKVMLYETARGDVTDEKKQQILQLLESFINTSKCMGKDDLTKNLESLKSQALMLAFPDDAGDMLADLHRCMNLIMPESYIEEAASETAAYSEKAAAKQPDTPPANLDSISQEIFEEEENYEEEYDDELLDIFIEHLKENISLLRERIKELGTAADKNELLNTCLGLVNSLHSSANYMDYKNLTRLYEQWAADIEAVQEKLGSGETPVSEVFRGTDIKSGMKTYISEIVKRFPQHLNADEDSVEESSVAGSAEDEELLSIDVSEIEEETLASLGEDEEDDEDFPESLIEDAKDAVASLHLLDEDEDEPAISEPADLSSRAAKEAEPVRASDYQGLFDELDDVFEPDTDQIAEPELDADTDADEGQWEEKLSNGISLTAEPLLPDTEAEETPQLEAARVEPEVLKTEEASDQAPAKPPSPKAKEDRVRFELPSFESLSEDAQEVHEPAEGSPAEIPAEKLVKHTLRVDARKIDALMNQVGELVVSRAWFSQLYHEMRELQRHLHENVRLNQREMKPVRALTFKISEATVALGRVANELQEGVMKVRMLPIAQLFNRYPRLVRDLVHDLKQKKQVRLEIVGEETELDKMVIEEISDPLIHIIRNAVDHGCETVDERRKARKPDECTLKLESYHESNHVVIEISDDGRGINPAVVKRKAVEKKFFTQDELDRMTPRELMSIIMKPGFSTAAEVSKTSGRGVGMDVVKKNVEKLNGTIEIDSKPGVGTRFRIKIPLTLAIIQALLVRVGSDMFTIPLAAVEETLRVFEDEISVIEGVEVIHLRDSTLSLLRLSEIFNIPSQATDLRKAFVVVVSTGMRQVGLVVDALIGQEETVIKPLVDYLQENSGFSGATILGDGRISLILDVYELVNMSIGRLAKKKNDMAALTGVEFDGFPDNYEYATIH
jgi:chemotaxis protein histidine kinase CheA